MKTDADRDTGMTAAFVCVSGAGVVLSVAALVAGGLDAMLSTVAGSALALANLWGLSRLVRAYLYSSGSSWAVVGALKMFLLFGGVFVLADRGLVDVVALMIGYLSLPAGIVATRLKPAPPPTVEER